MTGFFKKKLILFTVISLFTFSLSTIIHAAEGGGSFNSKFGIGVEFLGNHSVRGGALLSLKIFPVGLSIGWWDYGVNDSRVYIHGTYHFNVFDIGGVPGSMNLYAGPGALLYFNDYNDTFGLGFRGVFGWDWRFIEMLGVHAELGLNFYLIPITDIDLNLLIGIRFYFS